MKTAVIYARYSSDNQTEQSIEGQIRVCSEFASRNNICIVNTFIDRAKTGTNDNRSAFQKMMKSSSKKAWDIVLVYKLDRFSRNKYESAMHKKTLKDNGIKLVSATENIPDSPEGIILESLLEGMAEYYSAELSQKVTRGMNESRLKGQYTGGAIPYGYKVVDKKFQVDEDEAKVVNLIYEMYANGVFAKDIIAHLTEQGILHNGKPFARNTVYNMLKTERYFGIYRLRGKIYKNIYPPIVSENVYKIVRQKVKQNHFGKHDSNVVYLLKNKVKCGYCNNPISSDAGTSSTGKVSRYYKCTGRKVKSIRCKKSIIKKELLEDIVVETTFKLFENNKTIELLTDKIFEIHKNRIADNSTILLLQKEKSETTQSINNLLSCIEKGIMSDSIKERIENLESKLSLIENQLSIQQSKDKIQITKEDINKYLRTSLKKEPKIMIQLLVREVILYDDKIEIHYNYVENKKRPDDDNHQVFIFYNETYEKTINENHHTRSKIKLKIEAAI